jgi:hypothetical protein
MRVFNSVWDACQSTPSIVLKLNVTKLEGYLKFGYCRYIVLNLDPSHPFD